MKTRKKSIWILVLLFFVCSLYAQRDPKELKFPDIEFKPEKPQMIKVKPCVECYLKEDNEYPAVMGYIIIRSGSLHDDPNKKGLASLTYRLLQTGGCGKLTPEQVEERLDYLGSSISMYAGSEFSPLNFWTLKKNFPETWKILLDMLCTPLFDSGRLELEKKKELEAIRRRFEYPASIGRLVFQDLIYGKDFPDTKRTTAESINSITVEDIRNFYQENIKDKEVIIALTGDFKTSEMISMVRDGFKDWAGLAAKKLNIPPVKMAAKPGVYLVDKPDMTQAVVFIGHLGLNRHDPDNVEFEILDFIYGSGGFNSRLMREVRSNRGLAYSTYGYMGLDRDKGLFSSFVQTKSQSAAEAVKLIKEIMEDIAKNPVKAEELETAKKSTQNSFVHRFDSALSVILEVISLKLVGYPDDYLEKYIPRIKRVDAAKLLQMAKRSMHPQELVILVVGKKAELLDQLKALGLGEVRELALPKE